VALVMFRFTIRDVLWLMVVVGMGVAWSFSGMPEAERLRRENDDLEQRMIKLAKQWAKEKGEPILIDTGRHPMEIMPDGSGTVYGRDQTEY